MAKNSRYVGSRLATTVNARYYPDETVIDAYYLDGRFTTKQEARASDFSYDREDRGFLFSLFAYPSEEGQDVDHTSFAGLVRNLNQAVKEGNESIDTQINDLADLAVSVGGKATLPEDGVRQSYFAGLIVKEGELAAVTTMAGCAFLFRDNVLYPLTAGDYTLDPVDLNGNPVQHLNDYAAGVAGTIRYSNLAQIKADDFLILCNKELLDILGQREVLRILSEGADSKETAATLITSAAAKQAGVSLQVMVIAVDYVESMEKDEHGDVQSVHASAERYYQQGAESAPQQAPYGTSGGYSQYDNNQETVRYDRSEFREAAAQAASAGMAGATVSGNEQPAYPQSHQDAGTINSPAHQDHSRDHFQASPSAQPGPYGDQAGDFPDYQNANRYAQSNQEYASYPDPSANPGGYADQAGSEYGQDAYQPNAADYEDGLGYDDNGSYPADAYDQGFNDQANAQQYYQDLTYTNDVNNPATYPQGGDDYGDQAYYDQGYPDDQGYADQNQAYDPNYYDQNSGYYPEEGDYDQDYGDGYAPYDPYDDQAQDPYADQADYGYDDQGYYDDGYQDQYYQDGQDYPDEYDDYYEDEQGDKKKRIIFYVILLAIMAVCIFILVKLLGGKKQSSKESSGSIQQNEISVEKTSEPSENKTTANTTAPKKTEETTESSDDKNKPSDDDPEATGDNTSGDQNNNPKTGQTYTVKSNDTFYGIIVSYYGSYDEAIINKVLQANPQIENIDNISLGQQIVLPPLSE